MRLRLNVWAGVPPFLFTSIRVAFYRQGVPRPEL